MATSTTPSGHAAEHVALSLVEQLPVLVILIPFVAAPLIVFIGSRRLAWPLTFAASALFSMS